MARLPNLISFIEFTHAFREIERAYPYPGTNRKENDSEHSFQLALAGWYIVDTEKLSLDKDLIIRYSLVHDLVEVYAGDTFFYEKDKKVHELKHKKEKEARERIKKEFPSLGELHTLIENYEKREDKESMFVYALDKLLPMINIYLDGGRTWKEKGVTLSMALENKIPKIALSEEIKKFFDELIPLLQKDEQALFSKEHLPAH